MDEQYEQEFAYCDWCGKRYDSDDLTIMPQDGLACEDCYEGAMEELRGE